MPLPAGIRARSSARDRHPLSEPVGARRAVRPRPRRPARRPRPTTARASSALSTQLGRRRCALIPVDGGTRSARLPVAYPRPARDPYLMQACPSCTPTRTRRPASERHRRPAGRTDRVTGGLTDVTPAAPTTSSTLSSPRRRALRVLDLHRVRGSAVLHRRPDRPSKPSHPDPLFDGTSGRLLGRPLPTATLVLWGDVARRWRASPSMRQRRTSSVAFLRGPRHVSPDGHRDAAGTAEAMPPPDHPMVFTRRRTSRDRCPSPLRRPDDSGIPG